MHVNQLFACFVSGRPQLDRLSVLGGGGGGFSSGTEGLYSGAEEMGGTGNRWQQVLLLYDVDFLPFIVRKKEKKKKIKKETVLLRDKAHPDLLGIIVPTWLFTLFLYNCWLLIFIFLSIIKFSSLLSLLIPILSVVDLEWGLYTVHVGLWLCYTNHQHH